MADGRYDGWMKSDAGASTGVDDWVRVMDRRRDGRGLRVAGRRRELSPLHSTTFTVDAALLRELGERLVGRSYIALAELVKNAYDADAVECRVEIRDDRITITDDGHGMSEPEFHEHWMRIGTTHKTQTRKSRHLGRSVTGSKGIGRLSVQFLADEMTLESISADDPTRHLYAYVDWTSIQHGRDLGTVNVLWETRSGLPDSKNSRGSGTIITLTRLRTKWQADEIAKLGRDVWVLRSPFKRLEGHRHRTAEDFYVDIDAPEIADAKGAFDKLQTSLFENWRARIRGSLDDGRIRNGAEVSVEFKPEYPKGIEERNVFREIVSLPLDTESRSGPTHVVASEIDRAKFEILIFKAEGRQTGGVSVQDMREYLSTFGNVSVYDSGFRLPYYGSSQDWLNVATDQGRRITTSALLPSRLKLDARYLLDLPAPRRIFGTVEIDTNHERAIAESTGASPGQCLQIQAGRDRLHDNAAFKQLRDLVRFSLDFYANRFRLLNLRATERERSKESPSRTYDRAVAVLDRNKEDLSRPAYQEIRREIVAARRAAATEEEAIDKRAVLLAPLATAGITALAMNHELAREIRFLERTGDRLRAIAAKSGSSEIRGIAGEIDDASLRFHSLQELFTPLLDSEDLDATSRLRVQPIVHQVVQAMGQLMPGVVFDSSGIPDGLRFPVGSLAEWCAILQNVMSNAWNAMLDSEKSLISLDGGRGRREWLRVSDTGVGLDVPLQGTEELFEPFERRLRISDANRSIAMGGQGLGLAIVSMIARRRTARAAFVEPKVGFATTIEISWKGSPE